MSVFDEPKVDCHLHILDPARFAYVDDTPFHPAGQEIVTAGQMNHVFAAYGVRNALLVQPNSGYGDDNTCLLATIKEGGGRLKGVAFVPLDISLAALQQLKSAGVIGVAFNLPFHGVPYYLGAAPLLEKLASLDLMLQVQVHEDQLLAIRPMLLASPVRLLIDHCGRPDVSGGLQQPVFQALLDLGRSGRAVVKLSGYVKFSHEPHPWEDAWPYVAALVDAFTLDACLWGSDWPFLRAPYRVDYGPLLTLVERWFPQAVDRQKLFWDTPRRLFQFEA